MRACFIAFVGYSCFSFVVLSLQDCDNALKDFDFFTGLCNNKWSNLKPLVKPTQKQVGYAWIQYKLDTKFQTASDAQKEIDSSPTPVVIGPGPAFYVVDEHHTLCSLDFSGYHEVSVTFDVMCDKRNVSEMEFWRVMSEQNLVYLAAHPENQPNKLPELITYHQLPTTFSFSNTDGGLSLVDDPWRSLAGFSRKVQDVPSSNVKCSKDEGDCKYCERCMFRGCENGYQSTGRGVAFFEFRWSYFMNDAAFYRPTLWDNDGQYQEFLVAYNNLSQSIVGKVDTQAWFDTAILAISLCRSKGGGEYRLPTLLFPSGGVNGNSLPGYYYGYEKLKDDPNCNTPTCI